MSVSWEEIHALGEKTILKPIGQNAPLHKQLLGQVRCMRSGTFSLQDTMQQRTSNKSSIPSVAAKQSAVKQGLAKKHTKARRLRQGWYIVKAVTSAPQNYFPRGHGRGSLLGELGPGIKGKSSGGGGQRGANAAWCPVVSGSAGPMSAKKLGVKFRHAVRTSGQTCTHAIFWMASPELYSQIRPKKTREVLPRVSTLGDGID